MVGRMKLHLKSNPIPARDAQRAQTKPCVHHDPGTPQRLCHNCVCVCPMEAQVRSGLLQGQGLWVATDLGHTACGLSLLGGGQH